MALADGIRRGVPAVGIVEDDALPEAADVVVVGGGIAGVTAARALARRGLSVVLCEKGRVAAEQSSRNWGWVRQLGRDAAEMPLIVESLRLWRALASEGVETGFRETGIAYMARTPREASSFEGWERQARDHGLPIRRLRGAAIADLLPGLHRGDGGVREVLHMASDGRAEPALAVPALARAAKAEGVRVVQGCAVRGLDMAAGRVAGVVTERGRVRADAVLVAGGAWSRLLLGREGVRFPQLRVVGTVMRVETAAALPAFPLADDDVALRRREDGGYTLVRRNANVAAVTPDSVALLPDFLPAWIQTWRELRVRVNADSLAAWRTPRRWALDAASPFEAARVLDPDPDPGQMREALAGLRRAFPAADDLRATHAWGGAIDATPDAVPAIGAVPGRPGLWMSTGFSGHGFGIGPGAGQLAADLLSGARPAVDPAPFSPARFIGDRRAAPDRTPDRAPAPARPSPSPGPSPGP